MVNLSQVVQSLDTERLEAASIFHDEAMALVDDANEAERLGDLIQASESFLAAYEKERLALDAIKSSSVEPTHSVLLRSTAAIALECGKLEEADSYISEALAGNPPKFIIEELIELRDEINQRGYYISQCTSASQHDIMPSEIINEVSAKQDLYEFFFKLIYSFENEIKYCSAIIVSNASKNNPYYLTHFKKSLLQDLTYQGDIRKHTISMLVNLENQNILNTKEQEKAVNIFSYCLDDRRKDIREYCLSALRSTKEKNNGLSELIDSILSERNRRGKLKIYSRGKRLFEKA